MVMLQTYDGDLRFSRRVALSNWVKSALAYMNVVWPALGAALAVFGTGLMWGAPLCAEQSVLISFPEIEITNNAGYDRENESAAILGMGVEYRRTLAIDDQHEAAIYLSLGREGISGEETAVTDSALGLEISGSYEAVDTYAGLEASFGPDPDWSLTVGASRDLWDATVYGELSRDWWQDGGATEIALGVGYALDLSDQTAIGLSVEVAADLSDPAPDRLTTVGSWLEHALSDQLSLNLSIEHEDYVGASYADGYRRTALTPALSLAYVF